MTDLELGWFVGFFEGEGCFVKGGGKVGLAISQKQREPLDRVASLVGGRVHGPFPGRHDCYDWTLYGTQAVLELAEFMRPLLSPRRLAQLEAMLAAWRERPLKGNWWAKRTHCLHDHPFTETNTYRAPNGERRCRTCRWMQDLNRQLGGAA